MRQAIQVTIEQAYDEACRTIGEVTVQQRIMEKHLMSQIKELTAERDAAIKNIAMLKKSDK